MFLDDVKKLAKKTQPKNGRFHTTTYSRLYVSWKYLLRFLQDKISFVRVGFSPQQKRKSEFYYYLTKKNKKKRRKMFCFVFRTTRKLYD